MKGIYIHIPFCEQKCYYCDFNSFPSDDYTKKNYMEHLLREIELNKQMLFHFDGTVQGDNDCDNSQKDLKGYEGLKCNLDRNPNLTEIFTTEKKETKNEKIESIFIGGGTPSIIDEGYIIELMEKLREVFGYSYSKDIEITIESNPGTLTYEKLLAYKKAGINRLSIGLQSCVDDELLSLGRIHNYDDFERNYFLARKAGFDNINIDLMFAIPGQTLDSLNYSLDKVISLNPEHISAYSLIVEEETPFGRMYENGELKEVDEQTYVKMYRNVVKKLELNGYEQYEISNYAKNQRMCRHNLMYWMGGDYLAIGLGSSGFINDIRYSNAQSLDKYFSMIDEGKLPIDYRENLSKEDIINEKIILSLRTNMGLDAKELKDVTEFDILLDRKNELENLSSNGCIEINGENIRLTQKGREISNSIYVELMVDSNHIDIL